MTEDTHPKRYSEAFKRQVVQEYEAGSSFEHLRRKYGIGGKTTIQKWVRHYSPWNEEENSARAPGEVQRLEERIQWLEKAVSELTIDKLLLQSTLEAYQEVYGEELVKKTGNPSFSGLISKSRDRLL